VRVGRRRAHWERRNASTRHSTSSSSGPRKLTAPICSRPSSPPSPPSAAALEVEEPLLVEELLFRWRRARRLWLLRLTPLRRRLRSSWRRRRWRRLPSSVQSRPLHWSKWYSDSWSSK